MKILDWVKKVALILARGFTRFPVSLLLAYAMAVIFIVLNHQNNTMSKATQDTLMRIAMTLGMGIPLSLGLKLAIERKALPMIFQAIIWIIPGLALAAYGAYMIPNFTTVSISRYTLLLGAIILGFIVVPYFYRREGLPLFTSGTIIRALVSALYSVILMLSLFAIVFTLDKLLNIKTYSTTYSDIALAVWAAFAPTFFIANIPSVFAQPQESDSPKTLRFLMIYILAPLLVVYELILYAYSAKILITLTWPVGMVARLVLSFAAIGILIVYLITPVQEGNRFAGLFTKWFPRTSLPLFLILFAALGVRINTYGFSEPRYFALVLAVWSFAMMLYIVFVKHKHLIVLPITLALVAVISVVGPTSAYSVSQISQNSRFEGILERNSMLKDGLVIPAQKTPSEADQREMTAIIQYFERNHSLKQLRSIPVNFRAENSKDFLGFTYAGSPYPSNVTYVGYYREDMSQPFVITGFDYLLSLQANGAPAKQPPKIYSSFRSDTMVLEVLLDGKVAYSKNLVEELNKLYEKYGSKGKQGLTTEEMTFDDESDSLKVRIILQSINGGVQNGIMSQQMSGFADGYILVKIK